MVQDTKKVQTLINRLAIRIEEARTITDLKNTYLEHSPSITGTPIQGKGAEVMAWILAVEELLNDPIADLIVDAKVPSHRGKAL